jgi:DNA polymerase III sliding clamp (beta) subunit (PCNA family)
MAPFRSKARGDHVSAHLLFDIARKLPDGSQVSLETADNRMTVKAGRSRFSCRPCRATISR